MTTCPICNQTLTVRQVIESPYSAHLENAICLKHRRAVLDLLHEVMTNLGLTGEPFPFKGVTA